MPLYLAPGKNEWPKSSMCAKKTHKQKGNLLIRYAESMVLVRQRYRASTEMAVCHQLSFHFPWQCTTNTTSCPCLSPKQGYACRQPSAGSIVSVGLNLKKPRPNWTLTRAEKLATKSTQDVNAEMLSWSDLESVLVVGATGGVGQLIVAKLRERGVKTHILVRDQNKAMLLFGKQNKLQVLTGDTRNPEDLHPSIFEGITHVICCTGTTAFPSKRWNGDNTPEKTDWEGVRNLVSALPSSIKRCVLVSSVGVTKSDQLPWSIMNLFGVLKYKKMGEEFLQKSEVPYTIIRPGRLIDGPYTSYDLNTLLKATAGSRRAVVLGKGDRLVGEASRHDVAEACIQALNLECTLGEAYEINSITGTGPGTDPQEWKRLFENAGPNT